MPQSALLHLGREQVGQSIVVLATISTGNDDPRASLFLPRTAEQELCSTVPALLRPFWQIIDLGSAIPIARTRQGMAAVDNARG
jgi:hypothetical protein